MHDLKRFRIVFAIKKSFRVIQTNRSIIRFSPLAPQVGGKFLPRILDKSFGAGSLKRWASSRGAA